MSDDPPSSAADTTPTPEPAAEMVPAAYPVDMEIVEYFQREGRGGRTESRGRCKGG